MRLIIILVFTLFGSSFAHAENWEWGTVDIVESWPNRILVQWQGNNSESCTARTVVLTETNIGGAAALERAYRAALTAAASGDPIRFRLDGCSGRYQVATVVQYCANSDCSY